MCEAVLHSHTGLIVCPPTSKVAISSSSGVSKETWLSLISPLEMPDDARRASRSAQRRRSFPSSLTSKFSFLLSIQSTGLLPGLIRPIPDMHTPNDAARRDFACASARPPDDALRKHSAPPSPTRKNGRHPSRVSDPSRPAVTVANYMFLGRTIYYVGFVRFTKRRVIIAIQKHAQDTYLSAAFFP